MATTSEGEAKPIGGFHAAAYDPADDPYAQPEVEVKEPQADSGEELPSTIPQMEMDTSTPQSQAAEVAVTPDPPQIQSEVSKPTDDPGPSISDKETPATSIPEPSSPPKETPKQEVKPRQKGRGDEPMAANSCRCCLM